MNVRLITKHLRRVLLGDLDVDGKVLSKWYNRCTRVKRECTGQMKLNARW